VSTRRQDAAVRAAARSIFEGSVGSPARRMRAEAGGQTNRVFMLENADGAFVLRMDQQADKVHQYRKERWAIDHARRMDIPVPTVIEVGTTDDGGFAFMLSRREPGRPATEVADTKPVLKQLGQYARKLHQDSLDRYGGQHDGMTARWETWLDFLDHEFELDRRVRDLRSLHLIDDTVARRTVDVVRALGESRTPRLNHGDLRLKNVLIDHESGRISAIIDWEDAIAAPAPEWDLALALHDLTVDEKDAFLDGYAFGDGDLRAAPAVLAALNMLHYAPFAVAAERAGDEDRMRHYRRRFAGLYDLYSPASEVRNRQPVHHRQRSR
jgi:Ser/Thr protein kinase RdoA (MazF antagonist)